jgi:hypothetical protein
MEFSEGRLSALCAAFRGREVTGAAIIAAASQLGLHEH